MTKKKGAQSKTKAKVETIKRTKKGKETKPESLGKGKRITRADAMAEIMRTGGGTIQEMTKKMQKAYSGSEREAGCHVRRFARLLLAMGYAKEDPGGKISLTE